MAIGVAIFPSRRGNLRQRVFTCLPLMSQLKADEVRVKISMVEAKFVAV